MNAFKMKSFIIVQFVLAAVLIEDYADATQCKPYSTFKVDCDECQCSPDGTQYSCTMRKCKSSPFTDNDFELGRSQNKLFELYLNDNSMPPENYIHNEFEGEDDLYKELNSEEFENGEGQFQDVSLGEQDASVLESELPPDHRRYANPKPLGLRLY